MPTFDIILIALVLYFMFSGFWFGLVHIVGVIVGIFVGLLVAGQAYEALANFLQFLFVKGDVARAVSFIVIFLLVNQLVGIIFKKLDSVFKLVTIIPFLGPINRFAGAFLGLIAGVLIVGTMLTVSTAFPFSESFAGRIDDSRVASLLIAGAGILSAFLPQVVRKAVA